MQKKGHIFIRILLSIVILFIGIAIYFIFNKHIILKDNFLFKFVRNYLLDGLWTVSFFFSTITIFKDITKKYLIATSVFVFVNGVIFELMQLKGIVNGTFDLIDILIYMLATFLACLIEKLIEVKYEEI